MSDKMTKAQAELLETMMAGAPIDIVNSTTYYGPKGQVSGVMVGNLRRAGWIEYLKLGERASYRITQEGRKAVQIYWYAF